MIKVIIQNKETNQITHGGNFKTQAEVEAWVLDCKKTNAWGKKAGFYPISQLSEYEISQEISRINVSQNNPEIMIEIPDQFIIESSDITQEVAKETKLSEGLKAQDIGAQAIAKVWAINESRNLDIPTLQAMLADQNLANIERLLWNGSLKTAKQLITALNNVYFSEDEKAEVLKIINDSGLV